GGLGWLDVAAEAGVDRRKRSVLVKRRAGDLAVEDLLGGGEVAGGDRGVVLGGGEAGHARVPGGLGGQEPGVAALADREGPQQEAVAAVLEPGDQLLERHGLRRDPDAGPGELVPEDARGDL